MSIMNEKLDVIVKEHSIKTNLMMTMRHGIYERQVSLRNILLMKDTFERDEGKKIFNSHAIDILDARNKFSKMNLNYEEKSLLEEMNTAMQLAYSAQINFIDKSIYNEELEITQDDIKTTFLAQEFFSNKIKKMIKLQKDATEEAVMDAHASYNAAKNSVYMLGGGAFLIGIFVTLFIIRLTESQAREVNKAISELKESHDRLEERVEQRTEQLALARDEALAFNKDKDTFLATMSHELRTPLNIIIGYSEILEEIAQEEKVKHFIPDLKKIQSAANHQLKLVNSILDISKIEEGKLDVHAIDFDIENLLTEIDAAAKPLMLKNDNKFDVKCSHGIGMMYSDNMRIRQILLNLISNAAKFTSQGSITLNVEKDNEGDNIIFEVQDTGVGIPDNYINKLFDKFTQEDSSTTRRYGGSGLGLSISKQLAMLLKGDITVQSEKGKGSTFSLSLPIIYIE